MASIADLEGAVKTLFSTTWSERKGLVVPETTDVAFKDGSVQLNAAFLYADLAASSLLAKKCPWETTAKIIRAYLECSIRLIRAYGGHIRSFDGDRVMGIFIGDYKETYATYCAREIDYAVEMIIGPQAVANFKSIQENSIKIKHSVGVDTGTARAVRAGIRDNDDLIWIGRAPSLAAKLSDIREYPYDVFISSECYSALVDAAKIDGGNPIWEPRTFTYSGESITVYRNKVYKTP